MKRKNLCNSCNNQKINWCDELKEHAMRGFYDCEWYSEKKEAPAERCAKCVFADLDNEHGVLYCTATEPPVKNDGHCLIFKPVEYDPDKRASVIDEIKSESDKQTGMPSNLIDKKVYIDPLVTRDEMASMKAEIKSESYQKISRLIQYLMEEYLVEDIRVEKVFEADKEFYRAKLTYREFPF